MEESSVDNITRTLMQRLQQARQARGLTQQEVFDATGIHIGRLEAKPANMTLRTLVVLCRYYGISLASLFADI